MTRRRISPKPAAAQKAQSFLEVAIFIPILLMMVSSLAEFGFLMNEYLNLIDGPREAARQSVDYSFEDAHTNCTTGSPNGIPDVFECAPNYAINAIRPVTLKPAEDDVVVSIYSAACSGATCTVTKVREFSWAKQYGYMGRTSEFTAAGLADRINGGIGTKPSSGIILVELFYNYHQKLALPWIKIFSNLGILPDPLPVKTYTIMPMTAAEPP